MDPTANLREQREIYTELIKYGDDSNAAERLAELVQALDEWISKGGFLPEQWQQK